MDEANGYDFTGKGIKDSEGNEMTGYAYVASEDYPFVMAKFYGSTADSTFEDYSGEIAVNNGDGENDGEAWSGSSGMMKFGIIGLIILLFSLFWKGLWRLRQSQTGKINELFLS